MIQRKMYLSVIVCSIISIANIASAVPKKVSKTITSNNGEYVIVLFKDKKTFKPTHFQGQEVIVYAKSGCDYCIKALDLLNKRQIPYYVYGIPHTGDLVEKRWAEMGLPEDTTCPQIFIDGKRIGGASDLEKLLKQKDAELENKKGKK